ncbi:MAG TPA: hypothetical protein VIU12_32090 [Chryseolinea sp.]
MTFNIPVVEVPGPEGSFNIPLSYHAGIGPEQEASWVGLGWNINVGSITRDINQYPDDASGESQTVTVQDLTGIHGWNRTFNHPYRDSWNSQTGYYGDLNLLDIVEVEVGSTRSVGIVGVHVGDNGVHFNGEQFANAVVNLSSWGVGSGATTAVAVIKQAAIDMTLQTAVSFAMPSNTPQAPLGGNYAYKKDVNSSLKYHTVASFISAIPVVSKKKSYHIYLDQTRMENMYGALYLHKPLLDPADFQTSVELNGVDQTMHEYRRPSDTFNQGGASDINFITGSGSYDAQRTGTVLAMDSYSVNAPGVSGAITPYRLEVGSVAMPREMTPHHTRLAPVPFVDYKVPFIFKGANAGRYFYHAGSDLNTSPNSPGFHFGLDMEEIWDSNLNGYHEQFEMSDNIFKDGYRMDVQAMQKAREPYIEWMNNEDLRNTITYTTKFIDFLPSGACTEGMSNETCTAKIKASPRYKFRTVNGLGQNAAYNEVPVGAHIISSVLQLDQSVIDQFAYNDYVTLNLVTYSSAADRDAGTISDHAEIPNAQIKAVNTTNYTVQLDPATTAILNNYQGQLGDIIIVYQAKNLTGPAMYPQAIGGFCITSQDGTTYHFALPVYDYNEKSELITKSDDKKRSIIKRNAPFSNTWAYACCLLCPAWWSTRNTKRPIGPSELMPAWILPAPTHGWLSHLSLAWKVDQPCQLPTASFSSSPTETRSGTKTFGSCPMAATSAPNVSDLATTRRPHKAPSSFHIPETQINIIFSPPTVPRITLPTGFAIPL